MAARPRTLPLAASPVVVGAALAWETAGMVHGPALAATLLAALLIQAGTNLWNDLGDALRGGDRPARQGPPRVTALGWAPPHRVRRAAVLAFVAAGGLGLYLSWLGGWPILVLGIASLVAGWAYSCGRLPLSHTPLGEVFVVAFFGLGAVAGTFWLQAGVLPSSVMVAGCAMGLPAAAVLLVNNTRDMAPDRAAGRRTLAILVGLFWSRVLYALLMAGCLALLPLVEPGGWLVLVAAPEAARLVHAIVTTDPGPEFNRILAHTARFQLAVAFLFTIGVLFA